MPFCTIERPEGATKFETQPHFEINGKRHTVNFDERTELSETIILVARAAGYTVHVEADEEPAESPANMDVGNGDAAAGAAPGGDSGGSDTTKSADGSFDPDEIIKGTIEDVEERLVNLSLEQLEAVAAAELDREMPRVGIAHAIEAARKAFSAE